MHRHSSIALPLDWPGDRAASPVTASPTDWIGQATLAAPPQSSQAKPLRKYLMQHQCLCHEELPLLITFALIITKCPYY